MNEFNTPRKNPNPRTGLYYENGYSPIVPVVNRKPRKNRRTNFWTVIAIIIVLAVGGIVVAVVMANGVKDANAIQSVSQPATASQVAKSLGCTNFTVEDPGTSGMVIDAGSCIKDGRLYAINTFPSTSVRDKWLDAAEPLGVDPKWETTTSVTYPSVS